MENKKETIESWLGWLQKRIPELNKSHNSFWVKQALEGCSDEVNKPKTNIEQRKESFRAKCFTYLDKYSETMMNDFFEYWAEHNENGRKMKFEMQKTFNIDLRLKQWYRRSNKQSAGVNQAWKQ